MCLSRIAYAAAIALALAAAACSGVLILDVNTLPGGTWAGDHATLVVQARGTTMQFDCAHAVLDSPIRLDRDNRFDVKGVFFQEHGGPIQADGGETPHIGRFFGSVEGTHLTLLVVIGDLDLHLGPYLLVLGGSSRLVRCL